MLFNSVIFLFAFLPVCYTVFWMLKTPRARYIWLAITGYVFYAYWDARFCLLMLFSTAVSYFAGLGMLKWDNDPRKRKLCMVVPIVVDLSLLGFFKYTNFFLDTVADVTRAFGGVPPIRHLDVILPIGISFYTFHTISYIVDGYRRVIKPTRNFFEFSAYVSLFSQLVAGPIVRFRQIEEDLEAIGTTTRTKWLRTGVSFFVVGLVEKVIIADSLAAFVDPALAAHTTLSSLGTWLAMIGYSFQLYFDFSGYSTMAVGLGYLFGIRIPQNFNSPYKALDPSDFWRRWHISLSTVMRDYLYIPMGGSRGGERKTYRNLFITMLLGGLWHGASWNFVIWGAYHGGLLLTYRRFAASWDRLPAAARQGLMFLFAVVGWVFFRATTLGMAGSILHRMFVPTQGGLEPNVALVLPVIIVAAIWALLGPNPFELRLEREWKGRLVLTASFAASLALILGSRPSPFLYFQF